MKNTTFYIINTVVLIAVIILEIIFYKADVWLAILSKWIGIFWMLSGAVMMIILVITIKKHKAEEKL